MSSVATELPSYGSLVGVVATISRSRSLAFVNLCLLFAFSLSVALALSGLQIECSQGIHIDDDIGPENPRYIDDDGIQADNLCCCCHEPCDTDDSVRCVYTAQDPVTRLLVTCRDSKSGCSGWIHKTCGVESLNADGQKERSCGGRCCYQGSGFLLCEQSQKQFKRRTIPNNSSISSGDNNNNSSSSSSSSGSHSSSNSNSRSNNGTSTSSRPDGVPPDEHQRYRLVLSRPRALHCGPCRFTQGYLMRYLMHRLMEKSGARSGLELMELLWSIWCRRDKTPLPSVGFTFENIDAQVQALRATDKSDEVFYLFISFFLCQVTT